MFPARGACFPAASTVGCKIKQFSKAVLIDMTAM